MARLYCDKHGIEAQADAATHQERYREADEIVLLVSGRLTSGPFLCDRCNAPLSTGDPAWLISAFPSHCRDDLCDYAFGYELAYFAMAASDRAASYGADWPDDSLSTRRSLTRKPRPSKKPVCALDLFARK